MASLDLPLDRSSHLGITRAHRTLGRPDRAEVEDPGGPVTEEQAHLATSLLVTLGRYVRSWDVALVLERPGTPPLTLQPRMEAEQSFAEVRSEVGSSLASDDAASPDLRPLPLARLRWIPSPEEEPDDSAVPGGPLLLDVVPTTRGLEVRLQADARDMGEGSATRFLSHWEALRSAARSTPGQELARLPLMGEEERHRVVEEWNATATGYPGERSVPDLVRAQAADRPTALAVEDGRRSWSYAELVAHADRIAGHLRGRGVESGSLVGVAVDRSAELVAALLGVLRAGCAYVPLEPAYPDERLEFMLRDTGVGTVLCDAAAGTRLEELSTAGPELLQVERLLAEEPDTPQSNPGGSGEDLAYVMYTSGSTGRPKGVRALHRGITRLVLEPGYVSLGPDERVMAFAPASFDASTFEIWGPLLNGGTVVVAPAGPRSMQELGDFIRDRGISTLWLTAALFHELVDTHLSSFSGVGQLLAGGDVLSPDHVRRVLEAHPGCTVVNGYGPTENTTFTACHRMEDSDEVPVDRVPIGRPVADTTLYVLGRHGEPMPVGVPGELWAGGDGVADGYLNRPELTEERFREDPFQPGPGRRLYRTGDLACWRPDGILEFLGRDDEQVKIRGYRVELGEVESRLREHPAVANAVCRVVGEPGGRRLAAYLVADGTPPKDSELRTHARAALPEHMVPSFYTLLPRLPVTANGKVDRSALPDPTLQTHRDGVEDSAPATVAGAEEGRKEVEGARTVEEWEGLLHDVWCRVLGVPQVDPDDRFFDVGGTSLLSLKVVDVLDSDHGVDLPIVALYDRPTIRSLAKELADSGTVARSAGKAPASPGDATPGHPDASASTRRPRRGGAHSSDQVVLVGMAGRFPGAADVDELWANLRAGRDGRVSFTEEELRAAGVPEALLQDERYVRATFPLDGALDFDADFFGFLPREAELMDPQQRLFLELAWAALEDAGYDPSSVPGSVGVFGGVGRNSYLMNQLATHPELADTLAEHPGLIGNERDFPTTHVSFRLGLTGPSMDVQTACSTSGVAVHLARHSLLRGESDMALVGGCKVILPNRVGYLCEEGGALTPHARIRAFDADADGMVRGSGGAFLVLKRAADAARDGDRVLAVVKGSAVNNDGARRVGFAAPSPEGQARVIADALLDAGVSADSIGYVEAHGTGTPLGDPIEIQGLTRAFREHTDRVGFCRVGSIKSNIGHLDAGAMAAGVVKTVLAMAHAEIPPTLHFRRPNPHIPFDESPFRVNHERSPWPRGPKVRRAGVSSFGLGGTNAHVVLEEPPEETPSHPPARSWQLLPLSARTPTALDAQAERMARRLEKVDDPAEFADAAHTLQVGRTPFSVRRSVVARSGAEAARLLREGGSGTEATREPRVAFLFPGGGSQHAGMAADLWAREPTFRDSLAACDEIVRELTGEDFVEGLFSGGPLDLEGPAVALPALLSVELALADLWASWGVRPDALLGHSMGEYAAAHLAGVFSRRDALALVAERGRLFEKLPSGSMLAVPLPEAEVRSHLDGDLAVAAVNRPDATVVSGPSDAVEALGARLEAEEVECPRVPIAVAAHSPMVEPILEPFQRFVETIDLHAPTLPVVSNLTGTRLSADEARDPGYWVRHLRHTVRFSDGLEALASSGTDLFLEVGPGRVLAGQVRTHPATRMGHVLQSMRHPRDETDDVRVALEALGQVWAAGVEVDWGALHGDERRRRARLPTYPFERRTYSIPPRAWGAPAVAQSGTPGTAPGADVSAPPSIPSSPPVPTSSADADPAPQPNVRTRLQRIVDDISEVAHALSGIEREALDPDATFLELGFDSLFLAQVNSRLKRHFEVRTSVRQLLEGTPSIASLAAYLDEELPDDFYPPEAPPPATPAIPASAGGAPASPSGDPAMADSPRWLIEKQLEIMRQQLALLGGGAAPTPTPTGAPAETVATQGPGQSPAPGATPTPASSAGASTTPSSASSRANSDSSRKGAAREEVHGPWRPTDSTRRTLGAEQQAAIDDLTRRVNARTARSKAWVAEHRDTLADPRSVVGFRSEWKELTYPLVVDAAHGGRIRDLDGHEYVDVVGAFGVNLLGHSPDFVTRAVQETLEGGFAIGPQIETAGRAAKLVSELTGMERVTFCNTGSEAVLAALRIARTVRGRDRIASFSSHYHGIFDEVLVKAVDVGGTRRTFPIAPGIPQHAVARSMVLDYGDPAALDAIREQADELACVILEPVRSRNPALQPFDFVRELRELTRELGIPLIFDEMITGFRAHLGGAQALLGVEADLVTYGKVVGGGYPIGVVAGRPEFMDALDGGPWSFGDDSVPEADMTWFAGTFVRHPVAMAAAEASLLYLKEQGPKLQERLNARNEAWVGEMNDWFQEAGSSVHLEHFSSFFLVSYREHEPFSDLLPHYLLTHGVHSRETRPLFWSVAHEDRDWEQVAEGYKASVLEMQEAGLLSRSGRPATVSTGPRTVALTPGQQEIWLVSLRGPDASCAYNLCSTLDLDGPLDVDALGRAYDALVDRHEALRAVPSRDGKSQQILDSVDTALERVALSGLSTEEARRRQEELERAEVATPFDLRKGPLVRARLLRFGPTRHRLLLTAHHMICDGWSCGVLLRNLAELYRAEAEGGTADLPPVMQLSEWVEACEARAESDEGRESMDYWADRLADPPPPLELPSDGPRPALKTFGARRVWLTLEPDTCRRIRAGARELDATLFVTLLSGFYSFLNRVTGGEDLVVGFSLAGQSRHPGRDLVSHCVDFLPIRAQVDPDRSFQEHTVAIRGQLLDAMEYQHCTFGELVRRVSPPRDRSRVPLAQVAFNLDPSTQGITVPGLKTEVGSVPRAFENMDAFFNVVEQADAGLEIQCTYNLDLYAEGRVRRWLTALRDHLLDAVGRPDTSLSELALDPLPNAPTAAPDTVRSAP